MVFPTTPNPGGVPMIRLTCTADEIPPRHDDLKMEAVYLTAMDFSRSGAAKATRCTETTVRSYVKAYQARGTKALKPSGWVAVPTPGKRDNGSRRSPDCKKARVQCGHISTGWDCNTAKSHPFPPKRIPRSRRPFSPIHGNRFSRKPKRACATYSSWAPFWLFVGSDTDFCSHLPETPTL